VIFSINSYAYELIATPFEMILSKEVRDIWRKDLFQTDEIVVVGDSSALFDDLKEAKIDESTIKLLKSNFSSELPNHLGQIYSIYNYPIQEKSGFLLLPEKVKRKIPAGILKKIYIHSLEAGHNFPKYKVKSQEFLKRVKKWSIPKKAKKMILARIIDTGDQKIIPLSPDIWKFFPNVIKDEIIDDYFLREKAVTREAVRLEVKVSSKKDIKKMVEKYVPLEHREKKKLLILEQFRKSRKSSLLINMEDLLDPFVKKKLNSFEIVGGPNCINSALCVSSGDSKNSRYVSHDELTKRLKNEYFSVNPLDRLQTSDLLLYTRESGEKVHAAIYIDDEYVFTKNGINKFQPYLYQTTENMERVYFPNNSFQVHVYRHNKNKIPEHMNPKAAQVFFEKAQGSGPCPKKVIRNLTNE